MSSVRIPYFSQVGLPPKKHARTTNVLKLGRFQYKKALHRHAQALTLVLTLVHLAWNWQRQNNRTNRGNRETLDDKNSVESPMDLAQHRNFQEYCSYHQVQTIIHTKRCAFLDPGTGKPTLKQPTFDVIWVCVDLALERDILFSAESSKKDQTAKASQPVKTCWTITQQGVIRSDDNKKKDALFLLHKMVGDCLKNGLWIDLEST